MRASLLRGEADMTFAYNVFLRHNSKDKPGVEAIAKFLQQEYQLKCWLDKIPDEDPFEYRSIINFVPRRF
jgi:hypothetical protein